MIPIHYYILDAIKKRWYSRLKRKKLASKGRYFLITNAETDRRTSWVGAWYAAPSRMLSANLSGRTLRQIVHLHAGGEQIRLRLSNRYGDAAVTLTSISVGQVLQRPMVAPGEQVVHFAGQPMVTLEAGQEVVSDPVALRAGESVV